MKLLEFVYPDVNVTRSVNLERDRGYETTLKDYQITGKGVEILRRFSSALNGERISAWSLTGPYGMGKSAFVNYLLALTGKKNSLQTELAQKKLENVDNDLKKSLVKAIDKATENRGFFHIPITASYEPVNLSLSKGIVNALSNNHLEPHEQKAIQKLPEFQRLSQLEYSDTQTIIKCLSTVRKKFDRPIIIVIDEFGKNLEFMAHHPDKGDIFILQLLAESLDIYLWVCLHQSFEGYASGLTAQQRKEWNKVQGRFEDISFIESTSQMLSLIRRVLVQRPNIQNKELLKQWAASFIKYAKKEKIPLIKNMTEQEIISLYPIHPTAAIVLPELCRRFAQNDRTLFSFLCSGDSHALPEFLKNHNIEDRLPFLGINYLYDYFFSVSTSTFINRPETQRWFEIQDIIGQSRSLSPIKQAILKTVGVLNLIASHFSLPANPKVLLYALQEPLGIDSGVINDEIASLSKSILFFREYAQEYRLWEGSDFDIIEAIEKKKATLATKPLEDTLQKYCSQASLIASRHSYRTGTVRRFECKWMDIYEVVKGNIPCPSEGYDGLIVYAFGNEFKIKNIPIACPDGKPLVVIYCAHKNQIKEIVLEAAAAKAILDEAPELSYDGVARKEVRYRVYAAEDQLREYIYQIYSPNSVDAHWYIGREEQKIHSSRDLSSLLSELCDKTYSQCPLIKNEMINYEKLSNSAARARRELAEAMVAHEKKEQLGMTGYGPEVALYRTLFRSTGLHQKTKEGWVFVKPDEHSPKLLSMWKLLDEILDSSNHNSKDIAVRFLIDKLKQPPFGMREGSIPLFLCHYLIINADEIALYQEGAYKAYFGEAEIALLIKRPDLFSLKRYVPTGVRRDVVQAYFEVLNTKVIQMDDNLRNASLLKIIAPLLKFIDGLPQYTRLTRRISLPAQKLRGALVNSREPVQLLFEDIPEALGVMPINDNGDAGILWKAILKKSLEEALLELNEAYGSLNIKVKNIIMEAFGRKPNLKNFHSFRVEIHKMLSPLLQPCNDEELKPIIGALINECDDDSEWARGVAGQLVKKPVDSWHDSDIEPFRAMLFDISDRIQSYKKLVLTSVGFNDAEAAIVSLTRSGGRVSRKLIQLDKKTRLKLQKDYSETLNQPEKIRAALCLLLSESFKENK